MPKTILEQGTDIVKADAHLAAAADQDGAEVTLRKDLGRGWSVMAWIRRQWRGPSRTEAGVVVQKDF